MLQRINISFRQYIRPGSVTAMVLLIGTLVMSSCAPGKRTVVNSATHAGNDSSEVIKFSEKKLKKPLFDTAAVYPDQGR